jgi:hypothetical protein
VIGHRAEEEAPIRRVIFGGVELGERRDERQPPPERFADANA